VGTRGKVLVAAGAVLVAGLGLVAWMATTVIADTDEDIWPDLRDRQGVYLRDLSRSLQAYARDHGALPESLGALPGLRSQADLWGTQIVYERDGDVLTLRSAGPDRVVGTADDLLERDGATYASKRALNDTVRDTTGGTR